MPTREVREAAIHRREQVKQYILTHNAVSPNGFTAADLSNIFGTSTQNINKDIQRFYANDPDFTIVRDGRSVWIKAAVKEKETAVKTKFEVPNWQDPDEYIPGVVVKYNHVQDSSRELLVIKQVGKALIGFDLRKLRHNDFKYSDETCEKVEAIDGITYFVDFERIKNVLTYNVIKEVGRIPDEELKRVKHRMSNIYDLDVGVQTTAPGILNPTPITETQIQEAQKVTDSYVQTIHDLLAENKTLRSVIIDIVERRQQ